MGVKEYIANKFNKNKAQEQEVELEEQVDKATMREKVREVLDSIESVWTGTKEGLIKFVNDNKTNIKKAALVGGVALTMLMTTACSAGIDKDGMWVDFGGRDDKDNCGCYEKADDINQGTLGSDGNYYWGTNNGNSNGSNSGSNNGNQYNGDWVGDNGNNGNNNSNNGNNNSNNGSNNGNNGSATPSETTPPVTDPIETNPPVTEEPVVKPVTNPCYIDALVSGLAGRPVNVLNMTVELDANQEVRVFDMQYQGIKGKFVNIVCALEGGYTFKLQMPIEAYHLASDGKALPTCEGAVMHQYYDNAAKYAMDMYGIDLGSVPGYGEGMSH